MKKMVAVSETEAYAIARFAREAGYRYGKEGKTTLLSLAIEIEQQYEATALELNRQNIALELNRQKIERSVTA